MYEPERLEERTLMADVGPYARLDGVTMRVFGSTGNDKITIAPSASLDWDKIQHDDPIPNNESFSVIANSKLLAVANREFLHRIGIEGRGGTDKIIIQDLIIRLFNGATNSFKDFEFKPTSYISVSAGNSTIIGGNGNDLIFADSGNNYLSGRGGNDHIGDIAGDDSILGGDGNDTINGGAGNDTLDGGLGDDRIAGGDGIDLVDYHTRKQSVRILFTRLASPTDSPTAFDHSGGKNEVDRIYTDIENALGGSGNDTISGDDRNNTLWGGPGNDSITGAGGDDFIDGQAGNDILDSFSYDFIQNNGVYQSAGHDQIRGGSGFDVAYYDDLDAVTSSELLKRRTVS